MTQLVEPALGDYVRDIVTHFEGIVVAKVETLFEGRSCFVQPRHLDANGRPAPPLEIPTRRLRVEQHDPMAVDLRSLFDAPDHHD